MKTLSQSGAGAIRQGCGRWLVPGVALALAVFFVNHHGAGQTPPASQPDHQKKGPGSKLPSVVGKVAVGTIGATKIEIDFLEKDKCFVGAEGLGKFSEDGFGNVLIETPTSIFLGRIDGNTISGGRVVNGRGGDEWIANLEPREKALARRKLASQSMPEIVEGESSGVGPKSNNPMKYDLPSELAEQHKKNDGKSDLWQFLHGGNPASDPKAKKTDLITFPETGKPASANLLNSTPPLLKQVLAELETIKPDFSVQEPSVEGASGPRGSKASSPALKRLKQAVKNAAAKEDSRLLGERTAIAQETKKLAEVKKSLDKLPQAQASILKKEIDAKDAALNTRTVRMQRDLADLKIWNHGDDRSWDWKWRDNAGKNGKMPFDTGSVSSEKSSPLSGQESNTASAKLPMKQTGVPATDPASKSQGTGNPPIAGGQQAVGQAGANKIPIPTTIPTTPGNAKPGKNQGPALNQAAQTAALAALTQQKQSLQAQISAVQNQLKQVEARRTTVAAVLADSNSFPPPPILPPVVMTKSSLDTAAKQVQDQKAGVENWIRHLNAENQKIKSLNDRIAADEVPFRTLVKDLHAEKAVLDSIARDLAQERARIDKTPKPVYIQGNAAVSGGWAGPVSPAVYNAMVDRYNARLREYRDRQQRYNDRVSSYRIQTGPLDGMIKQRDQLVQTYKTQYDQYRDADHRYKWAADQYRQKAKMFEAEQARTKQLAESYRASVAAAESRRSNYQYELNELVAQQQSLATQLSNLQAQLQKLQAPAPHAKAR